jgi:hypothetical protein
MSAHHNDPIVILLAAPLFANAHAHHVPMQTAHFARTVGTKANSTCFAQQSLRSLQISTLLNAIQCGLKRCPNLSAKEVSKYLNPSPALAKGHMKCPQQGLHSTRQNVTTPHANLFQVLDDNDDKENKNNMDVNSI